MLRPLLSPLTHVCLYILLGIPQAKVHVKLNMTPDAFDDQYIGCEEEMNGLAPGLLVKEMSNSLLFRKAWEKSESHWQNVKTKLSLPRGFKDEHGRAIAVYTDKDFHGTFATEERKAWKSGADYRNKFQFKAFHYYLTKALQLLKGQCDVMYKREVFRGISDIIFEYEGSDPIRFGQFASSSFNRAVAEEFGQDSFFTIHTCFGAKIRDFSYKPEQEEVLIPVHEKFSVFQEKGSHRFVLWSTKRTCSHFNCTFLNGEKNSVCVENSATRGGIAFPSQTSPSLFGGSIILVHVAALKLFTSF